jgi:hypothetical protein
MFKKLRVSRWFQKFLLNFTDEHFVCVNFIMICGIQLTHVQRYCEYGVCKSIFTFHDANTYMALPNAWRRSVRTLS